MSAADKPIPAQGEQAAYWLRRCQGFRVDSEGRRIGIVENVLYGAEHDRPSAFLVRTGIFKRRLEAISLDEPASRGPSPALHTGTAAAKFHDERDILRPLLR
jgi:hypothetical protein